MIVLGVATLVVCVVALIVAVIFCVLTIRATR